MCFRNIQINPGKLCPCRYFYLNLTNAQRFSSEWIEFISNQADLQQRCQAAEGEVTRLRVQVNQFKSDKEASDLRVKHMR